VWALDLPTSGEYYVIKNYSTGNTYIGGSGSGTGAVKHEDASTNTNYQVFLVSGNNTDGYTFQQQYSGNYIQAAVKDKWVMAYSNTSSPFTLTDQSSYFNIMRKGQSDGIGADASASGSTLYSDKGNDKLNQWNFDAAEAKTILLAQLSATIAGVTVPSNISEVLDNAKTAAEAITSSNTNAEIVAAITAIKTAETDAYKLWAESFLPAAGGDYFVKVGGYYLNLYDTPTSNAATTVALGALAENINIADASQLFNIAKLSGTDHSTSIERYAVFSRKNMTWHIGDNGHFRNDWGGSDDAWRTVNFLYDGTKYAWQFAGSSANKGFLKMKSATELENDGNQTLDAGDFVFDIIPVFTVFGKNGKIDP
jgi:hypothetical protein